MAERRDIEAKRQQCWDSALLAYGTAYIFQRRAVRRRRLKRALTFFGLFVPALIGIIATRFYRNVPIPAWCVHLASVASAIQFVFSLWALVTKWDDTLSDAMQAAQKNSDLQVRWENLAHKSSAELEVEYDTIADTEARQRDADVKQLISDKEKRIGMKAGLFKYQRECAGCNRIPKSLKIRFASFRRKCGVCGNVL